IYGHNITSMAAYAPSKDEHVDVKQEFFEKLYEIIAGIDINREIIMLGDLNGKIERQKNTQIVALFGEETNNNDQRLISLCKIYSLKINNGFFKHKDIITVIHGHKIQES
ncbi:hypothetical protein ALC56_00921, partial [Trachymyrmex septentrionalis]